MCHPLNPILYKYYYYNKLLLLYIVITNFLKTQGVECKVQEVFIRRLGLAAVVEEPLNFVSEKRFLVENYCACVLNFYFLG